MTAVAVERVRDDPSVREQGTRDLLDALGAALERDEAATARR